MDEQATMSVFKDLCDSQVSSMREALECKEAEAALRYKESEVAELKTANESWKIALQKKDTEVCMLKLAHISCQETLRQNGVTIEALNKDLEALKLELEAVKKENSELKKINETLLSDHACSQENGDAIFQNVPAVIIADDCQSSCSSTCPTVVRRGAGPKKVRPGRWNVWAW